MKFEKFGKYILLKRLAIGGMAEIFLAKKIGVAGVTQFVVVKRILPQYSSNKNFVEMFKNEGRITAHLKHSNLVHIQDFGESRGSYFIEMEYISGCTLKELMLMVLKHYRKFHIEHAAHIIRSVASALQYIHESINKETGKKLNAIHRDISPHNIMISYEGDIKVIDFGIAKIEDTNLTVSGVVKGKFSYMSPEQIRGKKLDCRSDIFSLGTVFWELLCGRKLFQESTMQGIVEKVKECKVPSVNRFRTDVSEELEVVIRKSLTKDLKQRYSSASEIVRCLNKFLNTKKQSFTPLDFQTFIKDLYATKILKERQNIVYLSNKLKARERKEATNLKSKPQLFSEDHSQSFMAYSQKDRSEEKKLTSFETRTKKHKSVEMVPDLSSQIKNSPQNKNILSSKTLFSKEVSPSSSKTVVSRENSTSNKHKDTTSLPRFSKNRLLNVEPTELSSYEKARGETYFRSLQSNFKKSQYIQMVRITSKTVSIFAFLGIIYFIFQDKVHLFIENFKPYSEVQIEEMYKSKELLVESDSNSSSRQPTSNGFLKIFIQTVPSGGTVFLNDKKVPGKTPLTLNLPQNLQQNSILIQKKDMSLFKFEIL